ncbi:MAG: deoxynucleoside kinase [Deltaproteobacteria bacterium]|nr:deoxynucleoside kinase [Deltaproteobacteria bacterium]
MKHYHYIVIEGVIGVGKTTLVELLAKDFQAKSYLEIVEENPFLVQGFYQDIEANAFNTELFFLLSRFKQQRQLKEVYQQSSQLILSDYLFAKNRIFSTLTLNVADLELFDSVFHPLNAKVPVPDLIIYLRADVDSLLRRIQLRDRSFERKMDPKYIVALAHQYDDFFNHYHQTEVMIIDASDMDFVYNRKSYTQIKSLVEMRTKTKVSKPLLETGGVLS